MNELVSEIAHLAALAWLWYFTVVGLWMVSGLLAAVYAITDEKLRGMRLEPSLIAMTLLFGIISGPVFWIPVVFNWVEEDESANR